MQRNGLRYYLELQDGNFGRGINQARGQVESLDRSVNNLGRSLATMFAADRAVGLIKDTTELKAQMEGYDNVIRFSSRNTAEYNTNLKFIQDTIKGYKLPLLETMDGFSGMMAAMKGTTLEGAGAREIYKGVAMASTTLHMSHEKTQRVQMALNQIMSKGKLQAEELTGQLGESLPGANVLAAKAMGVTTAQLQKLMADGKVFAIDFLPRFAQELQNTYGPGTQAALDSTQARMNEVNNSIIKQKEALGNELTPAYFALQSAQAKGLEYLTSTITWMREHETLMLTTTGVVGGLAAAYVLNKVAITGATVAGRIQAGVQTYQMVTALGAMEGVNGLTASYVALSRSMGLTPMGLAVTASLALAGGLWAATHASSALSSSINNESTRALVAEKIALQNDLEKLQDANTTRETTIGIYKRLRETYPEVFKDLDIEKSKVSDVADQVSRLNGELDQKIIKSARSAALDRAKGQIDANTESLLNIQEKIRETEARLAVKPGNETLTANLNAFRAMEKTQAGRIKALNDAAFQSANDAENALRKSLGIAAPTSNPITLSSYSGTDLTGGGTGGTGSTGTGTKNSGTNYTTSSTGSSRGGAPIYVNIQTLKAADNITLENNTLLRTQLEAMINEILQRGIRDFTLLD